MYFISITVIAFVLSFFINQNNKSLLFFIILTVSFLSGIRNEIVGFDTKSYYLYFDIIQNGESWIYGSDFGFSIITKILLKLFEKKEIIIFIYAFLTNYLIITRLWTYRKIAFFPFMLLLYFVLYYPYTFNIMRQFIAIAIVFYASLYLERKQLFKFVFFNIFATSIHTSSIIGFLLPIFYYKYFGYKKLFIYQLFILSFIVPILIFIFQNNLIKYLVFLNELSISLNVTTLIFFLYFIIIYCLSYKKIDKIILSCYFCGIILLASNMFFKYMNRISFYYAVYSMPFWGHIIYKSKNKLLYISLFLSIVIFFALTLFVNDSENVIWNYKTIFD